MALERGRLPRVVSVRSSYGFHASTRPTHMQARGLYHTIIFWSEDNRSSSENLLEVEPSRGPSVTVACTIHIGARVRNRRNWILRVGGDTRFGASRKTKAAACLPEQ